MQVIYDYLYVTGQTQAQLARKAKINPSALNNLLRGRRNAGMITLTRLNEATGISVEKLVESANARKVEQAA